MATPFDIIFGLNAPSAGMPCGTGMCCGFTPMAVGETYPILYRPGSSTKKDSSTKKETKCTCASCKPKPKPTLTFEEIMKNKSQYTIMFYRNSDDDYDTRIAVLDEDINRVYDSHFASCSNGYNHIVDMEFLPYKEDLKSVNLWEFSGYTKVFFALLSTA